MRQVLRPGALGRPRGIGWRGRWEGGSGWGIHVNPWLIHVNVWQKPLQYCKVISLQLIKINGKKKNTFLIMLMNSFSPLGFRNIFFPKMPVNLYKTLTTHPVCWLVPRDSQEENKMESLTPRLLPFSWRDKFRRSTTHVHSQAYRNHVEPKKLRTHQCHYC